MSMWKGKRVAVTGAGGFIGSHLVERLLAEGARVRALVKYNSRNHIGHLDEIPGIREQAEIVFGDVRSPHAMQRFAADAEVVFHLAALIGIPYSYEDPEHYVDVNVKGTLNLLEACRLQGHTRLVHTSTSETYGTAVTVPIREDHPLQAQSPYAASKIAADKLVQSYALSFGANVVTVRPFNTFGPRQSARAVIPTIIRQAMEGGPVCLGNLEPVRDFLYVDDTVEGFLRLASAETSRGQTVQLAGGDGVRIGDLAGRILALMNVRCAVQQEAQRVRPHSSEVMRLIGDSTLARQLTAWAPQVRLDEGLRRTIAYFERAGLQRLENRYVL